ncbi:MAG: dicarboxylate/amino acid:cation symporter [Dysgonamonadaceae bacterium]|jgi:Na+/H+-dicarboxylate symporter|nr:dicarboxylate/amino acid:cation symporter [Dysgonamonadaceae bacterium]
MKNLTKRFTAIPLYIQILIGMILGIIIGIIALRLNGEKLIHDWLVPWGQLFIRLLQLIAIPLVFVTLIKGIAGLKDVQTFSRLGIKTMLLYLCFISASVVFGMGLGLTVKPGMLVNRETVSEIKERYESIIAEKAVAAEEVKDQGPLNFLNDIVPHNIVRAASNNSNMLQVIFFAVMFAVALLMVSKDKSKPVVALFNGLDDIIMKMVDFIIRAAPLGVTALMAGLVMDFKGDISMFSALGVYALTVVVAMLVIMFIFYPLVIALFVRKMRMKDFIRAMYPVQLFAFTTSSSAATLPINLETTQRELKVSEDVASFVLPMGVTINMDGTACYQAVAILFIAQVLGIDLSLSQLVVLLVMTVLSSIGTPGIPGGTYVILAMVLMSIGIPAEGLALIIGIDRPLDMLRTSVNVTGDATVACIIDRNYHISST